MADNYMKRCPTSYVIREMQTKTTVRHPIPHSGFTQTPSKVISTLTLIPPNADEDVIEELSFTVGGNAKWYNHYGRPFWQYIYKISILIMCSSNCDLSSHPGELITYPHKNMQIMLTVALIIIAKFGSNEDVLLGSG